MNTHNTNRVFLIAATFAVIAVGVFLMMQNRDSSDAEGTDATQTVSIDERITILMNAARNGDIETYHGCFVTPAIRPGIDPALKARFQTDLAATLKAANARLKGYVVHDKRVADNDREATLVLEKVFPEHNERYRLRLENIDGNWKIAEMTPIRKHAPKIKYGTPIVPGLKSE